MAHVQRPNLSLAEQPVYTAVTAHGANRKEPRDPMATVQRDDIHLAFRQWGARTDPVLLLVHGFTCQLIHWPQPLIDALVASGLRVVAFDNRDVGQSSRIDVKTPTFDEARKGAAAVYSLDDMADDAIAVLNHIGQAKAHIIGFSMGGMIGQTIALRYRERIASLTSIASSTGNPDLPGAAPDVWQAFVREIPGEPDKARAGRREGWQALGGKTYPSNEVGLGQLVDMEIARGLDNDGMIRQLGALVHAGSRSDALRSVTSLPTLVIHGTADALVPAEAAEDTANSIEGAQQWLIDDMGHDLPDPLLGPIAERISEHVHGCCR